MPLQVTYPGVYVQEIPSGSTPIVGVPTSVTAFVGYLRRGPVDTPVLCQSFADFERVFGGLDPASDTSFQVSQFFINGGTEAWVSRCVGGGGDLLDTTQLAGADGAPPGAVDLTGNLVRRTGIYALEAVAEFNLLVLPDLFAMDPPAYATVATAALDYAAERRAFAIFDVPASVATPADAESWVQSVAPGLGSNVTNGAIYFPHLLLPDPANPYQPRTLGPCGTVAGIYVRADTQVGVWEPPAGVVYPLLGDARPAISITDQDVAGLQPLGINSLRILPNIGDVVWGARTLISATQPFDDWTYVQVRRLALYIEQSLLSGLQWAVFEPNTSELWKQIEQAASMFLQSLFEQGAFTGDTAAEAFQCTCDGSTTTPDDIDNGIVNIAVMFAPLQPAEFLVLTVQVMAGQSAS